MKKKIVIGIIFIFCFSELKPLFPFFNYYINYDYISEVLCINREKKSLECNGKCYLRKQLLKTESHNDFSKKLKIEWEKLPVISYMSSNSYLKNLKSKKYTYPATYSFIVNEIYISPPTPPPESYYF